MAAKGTMRSLHSQRRQRSIGADDRLSVTTTSEFDA
jgi:hypothetical protein